MAELPTDIITEIFLRLPIKSLIRFQSVCKTWESLIKSPNFTKIHFNKTLTSKSDRLLLLYDGFLYPAELEGIERNHFPSLKLRQPLSPQEFGFLGFCNGLICIRNSDISFTTSIILFNPFTNSQFHLPVNRVIHLVGFGYDSKSDDYKVLTLVQRIITNDSLYIEAELYSLNNKYWKSVRGINNSLIHCGHGVLFNEALHYRVISMSNINKITSFDLHTESFSFIDCPKRTRDNGIDKNMNLIELGGCLCVFINYDYRLCDKNKFLRFELWAMKEYGNRDSWVLLFKINHLFIQCELCIRPIVYSKDGKRILLEIDSMKFGWYNLESGKFDAIRLPNGPLKVESFVGSLVSIEDKPHSET